MSQNSLIITQVARRAFRKASEAADLCVVIKHQDKDKELSYTLVFGIRKNEPGKGGPAWFGGFTDVHKEHITHENCEVEVQDSAFYTALKDGFEEAGLKISVPNIKKYQRNYNVDSVNATAQFYGKDFPVKIFSLGTIPTGDALLKNGGERYSDGTKRVHKTTGFTCIIDMSSMEMSSKEFDQILQGADDIKNLQFYDVSDAVKSENTLSLQNQIQFGIQHHNHFLPLLIKTLRDHDFLLENHLQK